MGLVATSFYTLSKHISIFRRFHLSYKAQKEKRPLLSQDRFLAKIAIVFSARRIPAVFSLTVLRGACADKMPLCSSHDDHEKSNSRVSMVLRLVTLRSAGAPLKGHFCTRLRDRVETRRKLPLINKLWAYTTS